MQVVCPNCGAAGQEPGKYCENCGYLIPDDAGQSPAGVIVGAAAQAVPVPTSSSVMPSVTPASGPATPSPSAVGAQFALVRDGHANLNEGFTIGQVGEFLIGRMDQDSGTQVDVDLRQWVQPLDIHGQKQYLVHRKQCYIGLAQDEVVTIRSCPGAEGDTLIKAGGQSTFTSLQNFATVRPARPDGSFELVLHDQVYMGDPDAVMYFLSGDPTAQDNYAVLELINKS